MEVLTIEGEKMNQIRTIKGFGKIGDVLTIFGIDG